MYFSECELFKSQVSMHLKIMHVAMSYCLVALTVYDYFKCGLTKNFLFQAEL